LILTKRAAQLYLSALHFFKDGNEARAQNYPPRLNAGNG
jgi:hypothetical protein